MERIINTTGVVCVMIFCLGIFYEFGKFEKTAKIIKYIIAVVIVAEIFKSITHREMELNFNKIKSIEYNDYSEYLYNEIITQTQNEIENIIKERLQTQNISYRDISVNIIEQDSNITVEEIKIYGIKQNENKVYDCIADIVSENTKISMGE